MSDSLFLQSIPRTGILNNSTIEIVAESFQFLFLPAKSIPFGPS